MTDVLVYRPDYQGAEDRRREAASGHSQPTALCWHSNHPLFGDLLPGDRLWVVTSGKRLRRDDGSAGYLVAVWPVAELTNNPGDDPQHPAGKYAYRVLVNQTEAIELEEPICIDHIIRRDAYEKTVPVGRFLRGPRRLTDDKVRKLRAAAGAELARHWLTASNPKNSNGAAVVRAGHK
jgi:hypothetical protein